MEKLNMSKICEFTKGSFCCGEKEAVVENIVIDSRQATSKSLFIPIIGETHDGHNFM